jgi:3-oxoadipate enol-lactonase
VCFGGKESMNEIQVNDTTIAYQEEGQGKPLFFIHGLGASHAMFEPQMPVFSPHYRVICPDMRGCGASGKLSGPIHTVLDRQCADVEALMDRLEIPQAVFCGVSYGGVFCFHFALRCPQRVAALVIVDSFGDTRWVGPAEAALMIAQYANMWILYLPGALLAPVMTSEYKRWPLAKKHIGQVALHMRHHETVLQRMAINLPDHTSQLHQLKIPLLGMVGDSSKLLIKYMQRALAAAPGSRLEVIPDSFDPSNLCQPQIFNQNLLRFLEEIEY